MNDNIEIEVLENEIEILKSKKKALEFEKDWDAIMPQLDTHRMAEIGAKFNISNEARLAYEEAVLVMFNKFGYRLKQIADEYYKTNK